jgi:hypothetical protein
VGNPSYYDPADARFAAVFFAGARFAADFFAGARLAAVFFAGARLVIRRAAVRPASAARSACSLIAFTTSLTIRRWLLTTRSAKSNTSSTIRSMSFESGVTNRSALLH